MQSAPDLPKVERAEDPSGFFSSESVLNILKLILAGSELSEVLAIIAGLVESQGNGTLCTIWLPDADGTHLYCAAAPGLPGFAATVGRTVICPQGASCGTAVYRREPVYVADILREPIWDDYRDRMLPYGIRAVWSRPLFTREGKVLGTFAILYREVRNPDAIDLQLIESASHIAGIAIERHLNAERLRHERDRLRLLLEITSSVTSKLDFRQVIEALSTNLFRVMQCDVSALLLPDAESGQLRVTILYNPDARGPMREGSLVPMNSSISGQVFQKAKSVRIDSFKQVREDPEIYGNPDGQRLYERVVQEGLRTGCYLPLVGRDRVVGVLMLSRRSDNAFENDDVVLLEQVARQVAIAVENALEYEEAVKDRDKETKQRLYLEEEIRAQCGAIVGESPALMAALQLVSVVAPTDSSVLILGETGTGKELFARAIHDLSARRERAFVKLNCAAIPLGLLESDMLGPKTPSIHLSGLPKNRDVLNWRNKATLPPDEACHISVQPAGENLLRFFTGARKSRHRAANRTHKVDVTTDPRDHRRPAGDGQPVDSSGRLVLPIERVSDQRSPAAASSGGHSDTGSAFHGALRPTNEQANRRNPVEDHGCAGTIRLARKCSGLQNFLERAVILSPYSVLRAQL